MAQGGAEFLLERAPETVKPVLQEEPCPLFVRAVSMYLDNHPLWSPANVDAPINPETGTVQRARIGARELARFETGQETELSTVPVQGKRPLDEHEISFLLTSDPHGSSAVMRLAPC